MALIGIRIKVNETKTTKNAVATPDIQTKE
jgi:hypothetical protein